MEGSPQIGFIRKPALAHGYKQEYTANCIFFPTLAVKKWLMCGIMAMKGNGSVHTPALRWDNLQETRV